MLNIFRYIVAKDKENTLESLSAASTGFLGSFPNPSGVSSFTTSVTIPVDLAAGDYVLQYRWDTYRNCADIKVTG